MLAGLAWLLAGSTGCDVPPSPASSARPNVLLITVDTLRADRLGCYGHPGARTPVIDRLAAEGTLFLDASTCIPRTGKASC